MAYELALPTHVRVYDVLHASLLKKYVYDTKHVIDWSLLQVEPEGEFFPEPLPQDKSHIKFKHYILSKQYIDLHRVSQMSVRNHI